MQSPGSGGRIVKRDVKEAPHQGQIRKTVVRQPAESL